MSLEETIIDSKKRFIAAQVRILSSTLRPSRDWLENAPRTDQADLSQRAVEEVLYKVNTIARHHAKAAYSSQAQRHVAEQIEALYWTAGDIDRAVLIDDSLDKGVDLRQSQNIARLPDQWPDEEGEKQEDMEKYAELFEHLTTVSDQIQAQKQKITQFKRLQQLLKPFENPQERIQPNLVTRDGELRRELDKMRILTARVAERVRELKKNATEEDIMDIDIKEEAAESKLLRIVGS